MKIYLDLCAIQRPLDTPNQVRIILEAEAVLGIIAFCDSRKVELVSSDALVYEGNLSPLPIRKEHTFAVLAKAKTFVKATKKEKARAENLIRFGINPLDALHLASAESAKSDYFCTVDDAILRNIVRINDYLVKVANPVDLIQEIEK